MGLKWSDLNPIKGTQHFLKHANNWGHKWFGGGPGHENEGGTDWYVGYDSKTGINANIQPGQTSHIYKPTTKGSRNVAATAKTISQGGMTKDEIIEYNIKHPNETALRGQK